MSEEELDEALAELEETRRTAERELEAIGGRREEIEQLERDRGALHASWSAAVLEELDRLTPEGRKGLYHRLRLEIRPTEDGYEVTGPFCGSDPLSSSEFRSTKRLELRFHTLLTADGNQLVELTRA